MTLCRCRSRRTRLLLSRAKDSPIAVVTLVVPQSIDAATVTRSTSMDRYGYSEGDLAGVVSTIPLQYHPAYKFRPRCYHSDNPERPASLSGFLLSEDSASRVNHFSRCARGKWLFPPSRPRLSCSPCVSQRCACGLPQPRLSMPGARAAAGHAWASSPFSLIHRSC